MILPPSLLLLAQVLIITASSLLMVLPDANPTLFLFEKLTSLRTSTSTSTSTFSVYPKNRLENKRVWITGASSGIGQEIAKQLVQDHDGVKVILSGRRLNELERVARSCLAPMEQEQESMDVRLAAASGDVDIMDTDSNDNNDNNNSSNVHLLPFDVTNKSEIPDIVDKALGFYGGIDILILNAGVGQLCPALEESYDTTEHLMRVNFHSPVQLAMEVIRKDKWGKPKQEEEFIGEKSNNVGSLKDHKQIPEEKKNKRNNNNLKVGHIVVTSSVAAKLPIPLGTSYAASKHATHGYFTSLRSECHPWLRVDLPSPGPINTKFQTKALYRNEASSNGGEQGESDDNDGAEVKMSAERCAKLIIAGMAGPKYLMQETWISKQPTLFFMFLNQLFPNFSNFLLGIIGSLRVKAWNAGLPLYKVSSWIKATKIENEDQ